MPEFTAPLKVQLCRTCGLSQLTHTVSPNRLYARYLYCSGVSLEWRAHCERLAAEYTTVVGRQNRFVVDIASNDGSLLMPFTGHGYRVLGVEPAENITTIVPIPTMHAFWSLDIAQQDRKSVV